MRPKRSHDENRKVCCFFCLRKGETKSDKELSAYEIKLIIDNFLPTFENFKDFLPLGCCGSCRRNLSYRFGKNPSADKYKPFPCESDQQFYQNVIEKLKKLPRGNGENKDCKCEMICESAHTVLKIILLLQELKKSKNKRKKSADSPLSFESALGGTPLTLLQ